MNAVDSRTGTAPGAGSVLEAAGGIATERYTVPAALLHWVMAALIVATFPLGLYMVDLPLSPSKLKYYSWHKWIGVTVFLLAMARVAWRFGHRPPRGKRQAGRQLSKMLGFLLTRYSMNFFQEIMVNYWHENVPISWFSGSCLERPRPD